MGHYCSVQTKSGWPCRRWLVHIWVCHQHREPGAGAMQLPLPIRIARAVELSPHRVSGGVVDFTSDIISAGEYLTLAAKKVAALAGPHWDAAADGWRARSCVMLANVADAIDESRTQPCQLVGNTLADRVLPGRPSVTRCFCHAFVGSASEHLCALPAPARLTAVAQGLRLAGIALCASRFGSIASCRRFRRMFFGRVTKITTDRVMAEAAQWLTGVEDAW